MDDGRPAGWMAGWLVCACVCSVLSRLVSLVIVYTRMLMIPEEIVFVFTTTLLQSSAGRLSISLSLSAHPSIRPSVRPFERRNPWTKLITKQTNTEPVRLRNTDKSSSSLGLKRREQPLICQSYRFQSATEPQIMAIRSKHLLAKLIWRRPIFSSDSLNLC